MNKFSKIRSKALLFLFIATGVSFSFFISLYFYNNETKLIKEHNKRLSENIYHNLKDGFSSKVIQNIVIGSHKQINFPNMYDFFFFKAKELKKFIGDFINIFWIDKKNNTLKIKKIFYENLTKEQIQIFNKTLNENIYILKTIEKTRQPYVSINNIFEINMNNNNYDNEEKFFYYYQPIFINQKLIGTYLSIYNIKKMIIRAIKDYKKNNIDMLIIIKEGKKTKALLYLNQSKFYFITTSETGANSLKNQTIHQIIKKEDNGENFYKNTIDFNNLEIELYIFPTNEFSDKYKTITPYIIFLFGTTTTILFLFIFIRNNSEKDRIKKLVISRTELLHQSQERLEMAIEGARIGIWDFNIENNSLKVNTRFLEMLNYSPEYSNKNIQFWIKKIHPDDLKDIKKYLKNNTNKVKNFFRFEYRIKSEGNKWKWILTIGRITKKINRQILRASGVNIDIHESKKYQENLEKISVTDSLTEIPNRKFLFEKLNKILSDLNMNEIKNTNMSVAILDIDHFKKINDIYGHQAGDFILKSFADLVKENIRESDILARYGGEEFIIIFMDTHKNNAEKLLSRIKKIQQNKKYKYHSHEIEMTFSAGISDLEDIINNDKISKKISDILLKIADDRLYIAKESGRNKIIII